MSKIVIAFLVGVPLLLMAVLALSGMLDGFFNKRDKEDENITE